MNILSDELTDLINKEDKATAWCLLCKVCLNKSNEAVNIERVFANLCGDVALCLCFANTFHLGKELGKVLFLQKDRRTVFNPLLPEASFILRFQPFVLAFSSKVTFYLCNLRFLVIKAEFAVELLQEDIEHGVNLSLTYAIKLLLNVEQYAFCRNTTSFLNITLQFKIITCFLGKNISALTTFNFQLVFEDIGENLQQVRFTTTEVTRDPNTSRFFRWD